MHFAQIDDTNVHYEFLRGAADAPVLVFANSLGTDFRIWDRVIMSLPEDINVLRYDMRGHGLSELGTAKVDMVRLANDLAGLMDRLDISAAILCGLSVGGMVAQQLAALRPDLVQGLVLCDTAHKIGTPEMWKDRIEGTLRDGLTAMAPGILARWFSASFETTCPARYRGARAMLTRTPLDGYAAICAAIAGVDLTGPTAALRLPVRCVVGAEDGATPPDLVAELSALIPGATLTRIDGAGHLPPLETPGQLARLITVFIEDIHP